MSQQATSAKKETARKTATKSARAAKATEPSLNMDELRELAELVDEHGFTDFEFENENIRVRLSKNAAPQIVQAVQPVTAVPAQIAPAAQAATTAKLKLRIRERKPKPKRRQTRIYTKLLRRLSEHFIARPRRTKTRMSKMAAMFRRIRSSALSKR